MTYQELNRQYEELLARKNEVDEKRYNGIYERWVHPVLTREHVPQVITGIRPTSSGMMPYFIRSSGST